MHDAELEPKKEVLQALQALEVGDSKRIITLTRDWTDLHLEMLSLWAFEVQTGQYIEFNPLDSNLSGEVGSILLFMLSSLGNASPVIKVSTALLSLIGN